VQGIRQGARTRRLLSAAGGSAAPAVPSVGEPTGAWGRRGLPAIDAHS